MNAYETLDFRVPETLAAACALTHDGRTWLNNLPDVVDELCARPRRVADGPDGWRITSVGSGRGRLRVPRVIGTHQRRLR